MKFPSRQSITDQLRASRADILCVAFILAWVAFLALPGLARTWNLIPGIMGDPDGRISMSFDLAIWDAWHRFGEFPQWNPYMGGGVPWSGFIYNGGVSILGMFDLVFGPIRAPKVMICFALLLAGIGMYGATRTWMKCEPPFALVAAIGYLSCQWMAGQVDSGNYSMMMAFTAPAFAWLFWGLLEGRWWGLLLPVLYQTSFAKAKYAPFILCAMLFFMVLVWGGFDWKRQIRGLLLWVISFIAGIGLAMPKLAPILRMRAMDRVDQEGFGGRITYRNWDELFVHLGSSYDSGGLVNNHIIAAGWLVLALAVIGAFWSAKRGLPFIVLAVIGWFTTLGFNSPVPVIWLVQRLPILETVHSYPKYFNPVPAFGIIALSALGAEAIWTRLSQSVSRLWFKRGLAVGILLFLGYILADHAQGARALYPRLFVTVPDSYEQTEEFHHVAHTRYLGKADRYRDLPEAERNIRTDQFTIVFNQVGVLTWYGNFVLEENAIPKYVFDGFQGYRNPNYPGMLFSPVTARNQPLQASDLEFTYNTIQFQADSGPERVVIINFNHDPYWSVDAGELEEVNGLLAVRVPENHSGPVKLIFSSPRFHAGLWLMFLTLIIWFGGFPFARRFVEKRLGTQEVPEPQTAEA